ncbi:IEC3 subunit of the Ino80 complex, chromatin re-modelling-domain-containing protein [Neurospora hispaniola]|uniref:IEC3 subunit of the Ino80 complex, chromatin re-modelling-domain-containing protein n=1 Tax=Neurospora hispaniola TaxID=588809 RepID=A0AAJ0I7E6_9PEZI|nr:IEC3 subunit of the Ino80 complex, chromatin re-modelling-domain-containing protein [Neurospora hispaniola]
MEVDPRGRTELSHRGGDDDSIDTRMADDKPTYRSWKKKYRKMRITFDQKMHEGEELYKAEQKALATARRLAIQKDRLLDLLLDVNNSNQIPPEKRFDLSVKAPSNKEGLYLDIDRPSTPPGGIRPSKSYKELLQDVPHMRFSQAAECFPELLRDLEAGRDSPADPFQGQPHPPSFLTADDIDNYIWEIDQRLARKEATETGVSPPPALPTLAPIAQPNSAATNAKESGLLASRDFQLRNPTSVYNWLRKHAPKTFLQDTEAHGDDNDHGESRGTTSGRGGRAKGERGGTSGGRGGRGDSNLARTKRGGAKSAAVVVEAPEYLDEDNNLEAAVTPSTTKGKRKRVVDDDPGYRPKGGSSRPTKKKRKSEGGGGEATPTSGTKRPRKTAGASVEASKAND